MPPDGRGNIHREARGHTPVLRADTQAEPELDVGPAAKAWFERRCPLKPPIESMPRPLNVLIVEDSPADAELLAQELRNAGFDPNWKRVETEGDYRASLQDLPDLIISDYTMPQFSGLRAMDVLRGRGLDIPFILISGMVGEEKAV